MIGYRRQSAFILSMIRNTACGKTKVSLAVVQIARAEIISFHF